MDFTRLVTQKNVIIYNTATGLSVSHAYRLLHAVHSSSPLTCPCIVGGGEGGALIGEGSLFCMQCRRSSWLQSVASPVERHSSAWIGKGEGLRFSGDSEEL